MCGIIGIISNEAIDPNLVMKMRDTLIHRGPDDQGLYINDNKLVAFGHRRLSIIDLTPKGKQPMSNEDGTIWIVFNGEIYNFKELKQELIKFGHKFKSSSDTEVIIHGYEEWGVKILERLRGMFAFGIWDENEKKLILARDRIGIKPLYYYYSGNKFIFASEIKAIIKDNAIPRKINLNALKYFLKYTYIPAPYSIWENIYKLPHAHYLVLKVNKINIKRYWNLQLKNEKIKSTQYLKQTKHLLEESIKYRFISDVPVGILLSGGLDSSVVTAFGSKLKNDLISFSVGFENDNRSELKYARIVANQFKTKKVERIFNSQKLRELLDKILYYYDEPLGVSSIFPTFLLMETASKYVKVALSGDGGDEVFGGYTWYYDFLKVKIISNLSWIWQLFNKIFAKLLKTPTNHFLERIFRQIKLLSVNEFERYRLLTTPRFEDYEINQLINTGYSRELKKDNTFRKNAKNGLRNIKDLQIFDLNTFLVDSILVKVDRASMANSLEVRVPFLDHKLLEYVMTLPPSIIFKNFEKKHILKKIAKPFLPKNIINRRKQGFSAPIVNMGFIDDNIHVLDDPLTVKNNILNKKYIEKLIKKKELNSTKLWLLILFELWYQKWHMHHNE